MIDQSASGSVQATEIRHEASGATVEYTDLELVNGTYWSAPPKICRGDVLLALDKEQCGTATRLCLDLLVDNWHQIVFGPCLEGAVFELQQDRAAPSKARCGQTSAGTRLGTEICNT